MSFEGVLLILIGFMFVLVVAYYSIGTILHSHWLREFQRKQDQDRAEEEAAARHREEFKAYQEEILIESGPGAEEFRQYLNDLDEVNGYAGRDKSEDQE